MKNDFAGAGKKRPQLNIPIDQLDLDSQNPRFTEDFADASQYELLQILYRDFDLVAVAYSMVANGYFDEEPIVVIPQNLPSDFYEKDFSSLEEQQQYLQQFVDTSNSRFTVVEGNRRTATAKLLNNGDLRHDLRVRPDFPLPVKESISDDLRVLPAICYTTRKEVAPYLGVRHINGVLRWEAYAKARYIATSIEEAGEQLSEIDRLRKVQAEIGDRTDAIRKQYIIYKIVREAEELLDFDTEAIKQRFSLLTVAFSSPSIRRFVGLNTFKAINIDTQIIPDDKLANLRQLLTWIFGDGIGTTPIITDSRRIPKRLAYILDSEEATAVLIRTRDLEFAYDQIRGEQELDYLMKSLSIITNRLESLIPVLPNYSDDEDVRELIEQAYRTAKKLHKSLK